MPCAPKLRVSDALGHLSAVPARRGGRPCPPADGFGIHGHRRADPDGPGPKLLMDVTNGRISRPASAPAPQLLCHHRSGGIIDNR
jgi:hypothetical protein